MIISELVPQPAHRETFKRNRERFIPAGPGCYVLTTFSSEVLYIGLSVNLRRRMNDHLDNPGKTTATIQGRAVLFYWLKVEELELNKVERTWLNTHIQHEGKIPILNKVFSPTSI